MMYIIIFKIIYLKNGIMFDDIALFIHIAEVLSLKATAEQLQLPLATVSRRLAKLERELGCLLFKRSTKGLVLTKEGEIYYEACVWHIRELEGKLTNIDQSLNSLVGELHVLAPVNFSLGALKDFWGQFTLKYPDIQLRIELDNKLLNFNQVSADLAIRIGELPNSGLIQTVLGYLPTVLVCAPTLKNIPQSIEALENYPTIVSYPRHWRLSHAHLPEQAIEKHQYVTNDITLAKQIAIAGAGIALLPHSEVYPCLQQGELVRIFPEWTGERRQVSIVRPSRNAYSVRAQCFHNALRNFIQQQPWVTH